MPRPRKSTTLSAAIAAALAVAAGCWRAPAVEPAPAEPTAPSEASAPAEAAAERDSLARHCASISPDRAAARRCVERQVAAAARVTAAIRRGDRGDAHVRCAAEAALESGAVDWLALERCAGGGREVARRPPGARGAPGTAPRAYRPPRYGSAFDLESFGFASDGAVRRVRGRLRNVSDRTFRSVRVRIRVRDERGRHLGWLEARTPELPPGRLWSFRTGAAAEEAAEASVERIEAR